MKILILNGPNLNMLGTREKGIYGEKTLKDINADIERFLEEEGIEPQFLQTNFEGELISALHHTDADGAVLNAGAFTHYSYALYDAIKSVSFPVVEVHMSNVDSREEFRRKSVIAPACAGSISGFGENSYLLGCRALIGILRK